MNNDTLLSLLDQLRDIQVEADRERIIDQIERLVKQDVKNPTVTASYHIGDITDATGVIVGDSNYLQIVQFMFESLPDDLYTRLRPILTWLEGRVTQDEFLLYLSKLRYWVQENLAAPPGHYIEMSAYSQHEVEHTQRDQVISEEYPSVRVALKKLSQTVLLGQPGAGKSTTLYEHCLYLIDNYELSGVLPLFIELGRWDKGSFDELVQAHWEARGLPGRWELRSVELCLDGLNEIPGPSAARVEKAKQLAEFLSTHPDIPCKVTCRTSDYTHHWRLGIPSVHLHDLTEEQVTSLLIESDLYELADWYTQHQVNFPYGYSPLLLTLLVQVYNQLTESHSAEYARQHIPGSAGAIFDNFVRLLWNREIRTVAHRFSASGLPSFVTLQHSLSALAFATIDNNRGTSFDAAFALEHIPDEMSRQRTNKNLLLRLAESCGLLNIDPDGFTSIAFRHHLFLEYFAARGLVSLYKDRRRFKRFISQEYRYPKVNGSWDNALIMACQLADDAEQFVLEVFKAAPYLATEIARALPMSRVGPGVRRKLQDYCLEQLRNTLTAGKASEDTIYAIEGLEKLPTLSAAVVIWNLIPGYCDIVGFRPERYRACHKALESFADAFGTTELLRALSAENTSGSEVSVYYRAGFRHQHGYWSNFRYGRLEDYYDEHLSESLQDDIRFYSGVHSVVVSDDVHAINWFTEKLKAGKHQGIELLSGLASREPYTSWVLGWIKNSLLDEFPYSAASALIEAFPLEPKLVEGMLANQQLATPTIEKLAELREQPELHRLLNHPDIIDALIETVVTADKDNFVRRVSRVSRLLTLAPPQLTLPRWIVAAALCKDRPHGLRAFIKPFSVCEEHILISDEQSQMLRAWLSDQDYVWISAAAEMLAGVKDVRAIPDLLKRIDSGRTELALPLARIIEGQTRIFDSDIRHLVSAYQTNPSPYIAQALGKLGHQETFSRVVADLVKLAARLPASNCYSIIGYIHALREFGIANEQVRDVLNKLVSIVPDVSSQHASEERNLQIEAMRAMHSLFGETATSDLLTSLRNLARLHSANAPSRYSIIEVAQSTLSLLKDEVLTEEQTQLVAEIVEYFRRMRAEIDGDSASPQRHFHMGILRPVYLTAIELLCGTATVQHVSVLKSIIDDNSVLGSWEPALEALARIANSDAINVMLNVFDNRGNAYNTSTHDRVCGYTTHLILSIGTQPAIQSLLQKLAEKLRPDWQYDLGAPFWWDETISEFTKVHEPWRFRNLIRAWIRTVGEDMRLLSLQRHLSWSNARLQILKEESDYCSGVPDYVYDIYAQLVRQMEQPVKAPPFSIPPLDQLLA